MKISLRHIYPLAVLLFAIACSHKEELPEISLPKSLTYDAKCQRDTITFTSSTGWRAESTCDWLTPVDDSGDGQSTLTIYLQQNDGETDRTGSLTINFEDGSITGIQVTQSSSDVNGYEVMVNLPATYGVGWGYDYSVDHADIDGVRRQIIDEAKLNKSASVPLVVREPSLISDYNYIYGYSSTTLIDKISSSVSGSVDLKLASAKVNSEFSKQNSQTKARTYVWYRAKMAVSQAYMNYSYISRDCLTGEFIRAVDKVANGGSVSEFVKNYGTHIIWRSYLGGKFDWYFTISQDITQSIEEVVLTISARFLCWSTSSTSVSEKTYSDIRQDFIASFEVSGGGSKGVALNNALDKTANQGIPMTDSTLITEWQSCFSSVNSAKDNELTMVDFMVLPIWEMVDLVNDDAAEKVYDYITNLYLQ